MNQPSESRRRGSAFKILLRLLPMLRPHAPQILLGLLMIPFVAFAVRERPLLLRDAINSQIVEADVAGLVTTAQYFFGFVALEYFANGTSMFNLQRAGHRFIAGLRKRIFTHVLRLPARYFDNHRVGVLVSRTTSDVEALGETLSNGVFMILSDVITIVLVVGTMFVEHAPLAIFSLAVAPVILLVIRFFSRRLRTLHLEIRRAQGVQSSHLTEHLGGVGVLQLFGRESQSVNEFASLGQNYLRGTKRANVLEALLFSLMDGISSLCVALMLYFGAQQLGLAPSEASAGSQALSLGLLYAFVEFIQRIFVPIREFSNKVATVQRAVAALERIYGLLDEDCETRRLGEDTPEAAEERAFLDAWKGGLRVQGLHFRYHTDGPEILRGIDFEVPAGSVVAVVGRSGSGKTSLGRVLTQSYVGYTGQIELLGPKPRELSSIAPDLLRERMLMVQQDVFLFDDSIAQNVALGHPELVTEPERVARALKTVQAAEFAQARAGEAWLELPVGERGRSLSVGESQLVAFARVTARAPRLLILDEATSSVDSATEQKVQAAVERLLEGRSVLVIAHRLSTVRHADEILVMDHGRIVERGRHEELLAAGGLYAELVESSLQSARS